MDTKTEHAKVHTMTDERPPWAIRIRTERKARGWPAEEMARRLRDAADSRTRAQLPTLEMLVRYVRRWEAGAHQVTERYRLLYARVFGVDDEELFADTTQNGPDALFAVVESDTPPITPDDEDRLVLATRMPSRLDIETVESLAVILAEQRRLEDHIGSAPLIEPVRAQLATLEALVTEARGPVRPRVLDVAAQWAEFAGWLYTSTERPQQAGARYDRAAEWAMEIGDATMAATVLSFKGHMAYLLGSLGR